MSPSTPSDRSRPWPRVTLLSLLLLLVVVRSAAAEIEITPFAGVQLGGTFDGDRRDAEIQEDLNYGLAVSWRVRPDGLVELFYSRQSTTLEIEGFDGLRVIDFDVEYFHFGGLWEIGQRERTHPFLGLSVGASHFSPPALSDEWAFSGGISGGVKHFLSENVGVRLEGRGLLTLGLESGAIFCGAGPGGGGCAINGSGSGLVQFQLHGGLVFRF